MRGRLFLLLVLTLSIAVSAAAESVFQVTTGADSGPGSLRQAILDANQSSECLRSSPCAITFPSVLTPAAPPLRIDLLSPLPPITVSGLSIAVANLYFLGSVAEIHGSSGDGFRFEGVTNDQIGALTLVGFSGHGIVVSHSSAVTVTAVSVARSGSDGILIEDSAGVTVRSSLINSNGGNGVLAVRSSIIAISNSFIGTDVNHGKAPNGGNGVHLDSVHLGSFEFTAIRNNNANGILITGDSGDINFDWAVFGDNGLMAIDIGADGPTAANAPVLASATFNHGWVRVPVTLRSTPNTGFRLMVYSTEKPDASGYGEGEQQVLMPAGPIIITTDASGLASTTLYLFDAEPGGAELRGRYLTAFVTGEHGSSEFSRSVHVEDGGPAFVVNSAEDSGAGSLRDAIVQANSSDECIAQFPCAILFRMNGPGAIKPLSALPPITRSSLWIDAEAQPGIEIDGTSCSGCNGLEVHSSEANAVTFIRDLTIHDFAGAGILITGDASLQHPGVIKVDGSFISANGTGIETHGAVVDIGSVFDNRLVGRQATGCVISGNRGDGIRTDGGRVTIRGTIIGADRTGTLPLGNGGAGIRSASVVDAEDNLIAFNLDRGVVITNPMLVNRVFPNAIHSNVGPGIDDIRAGASDAPEVLSARATGNETRIEFRAPLPPPATTVWTAVTFYASSFPDKSGRGEGRAFVGGTFVQFDRASDQYEFVLPRNYAGKFITATATLFDGFEFVGVGTTSEFSNAVQVTTGTCPTDAPSSLSSTTANGQTTFTWSALPGANEYRIWIMVPGDQPQIAYRGVANQATLSAPANGEWWVEARFDPCYGTQSEHLAVK